MNLLIALATVVLAGAPLASKNAEITDPKVIQAFLADPQTHAYNIQDPKGWKSFRKVLQLGTKLPNGSCRYPLAITTPGTYVSFATEIAVNNLRCQSLVLEGNPGARTAKPALSANASKSAAKAPGASNSTVASRLAGPTPPPISQRK